MVKFGAMNHPGKPLEEEIEWIGNNNFDFLDFTIEPFKAYFEDIEEMGGYGDIKRLLYRYGLDVVGHTAFYLPFVSPIKGLRDTAVLEAAKAATIFGQLKAKYMTVHLNPPAVRAFGKGTETFDWMVESMKKLTEMASMNNVTVLIENSPDTYWTPEKIKELLYKVPDLKLHIDIAHLFVGNDNGLELLQELLEGSSDDLRHLHMHDNDGKDDQHLPIGAGKIDWEGVVRALKDIGYTDTITVELHSFDKDYFILSRDKLKKMWMQL